MELSDFFAQNPKAALAFSGGTDSAYLLYAAVRCGADVRAYFIKTAFQPAFELEDARRLAAQAGAPLAVVELDVLARPQVVENGLRRCYHCKRELFGALWERARADGYPVLIDGTNASDDSAARPGMQALREMGVRSPLRECGITKRQVRRLSREAGLFTWQKPSYACLATRVPTGTPITAGDLARAEWAEDYLAGLGFSGFRVRVWGDAARLQLTEDQWPRALSRRAEIERTLRQRFGAVLLDFAVRPKEEME